MANSLGALVVSLGLNAAEFFTGLTKAELQARRFSRSFQNDIAIGVLKAEAAMKLFGEAAAFAIRAFPELINQAGHFQDLADKTGASAESLASFSIAAKVAATSIDDVANFSVKLSKNLVSVDDEASKTAIGLTALGIPIKEFKALDPAAQIERLSKALTKFNDIGGGKAAALESIAKGGAQLLPFLKELEASGGRQVTLTKEQIRQADEHADATARAKAQLNAYAQAAAVAASGPIAVLTTAFKEYIKAIAGVDGSMTSLAANDQMERWAERTAKAIAFVVDVFDSLGRIAQQSFIFAQAAIEQADALASKDFKRIVAVGEAWKKNAQEILMRPLFSDVVEKEFDKMRQLKAQRAREDRGFDPRSTLVVDDGSSGKNSKRILDGQLKDFDNFIRSEQETLQDRERFLNAYYRDDLLGLRDFFAGRRAALDDATANELRAFDQQKALLQSFIKNAKPSERIEAETKLADVLAKRAKLEQDTATKSTELFLDEGRAIKGIQDAVEQANIALAEMRGDSVIAALAGFDFAHRKITAQLAELRKSPRTEDQGLAAIGERDQAAARELLSLRTQINVATTDFGAIIEQVGAAQARVNIAVESGQITELEGLAKLSSANRSRLGDLAKQISEAETVAAKLFATLGDSPVARAALNTVDQLRLKYEQLAATGDLVAKKFNDIGSGALSDAIQQVVNGEKSLKQAALDFGKSVSQSITKVIADNFAQQAFGKGGIFSGFGDIFSKLFGPAKDAAGAAGAASTTAAATALTTSGTALVTSATALTTSGAELTTAGFELSAAGLSLSEAALALTSAASAAPVATATEIATTSATELTGSGGADLAMAGIAAELAASATALTGSGVELTTAGLGLTTAGLEMNLAVAGLTVAGTGLTAAAAALTSAAAALAAASTGSAVGSFGGLAFAANGSDFLRGGRTLVGEHGPEILERVPRGARVISNRETQAMGGTTVVNHINVPAGANTATLRHAAKRAFSLSSREARRG